MESNLIILVLCGVVILSYVFELAARKTGIPAVLFLIFLGVGLNRLGEYYLAPAIDFLKLVPVVGTLGLIMIVFEGALEIEYQREKKPLFFRVLLVSVVLLAGTTLILALSFRYFTGVSFYLCLINAVPLGIISSAIAIPSAAHLTMKDREFITLESSLSDILGIIFFNYVVINTSISFFLAGKILLEIAVVTAVSLVFCLFLLYLLRFIEHSVKFVLILAVMVFLYSLGKSLHLSSLIMVLMYGLILKNIGLVPLGFIQKHFNNEKYLNEFTFMQQITAEGVFLVKTFFFVIFGFIIRPEALVSPANLKIAGIIVFVILAVRLISLAVLNRKIFPELFYAPRGLISILLFMSIPADHYLEMLDINVLFLVIIFTSMVMILGSFWKAGPAEEKDHDFPV